VVAALVHALGAETAVGEARRAVHFIAEIATVTVAVAPEVRRDAVTTRALERVVLKTQLVRIAFKKPK
jgi:hypothetical protein